MADISKIKTPDGTTYNVRDRNAVALSGGTALSTATDLDTITTVGNYYVNNSNIAKTLLNSPTTVWFIMRVGLADGVSAGWPYQEIVDGNDIKWYRYKNGSAGWREWHSSFVNEADLKWGGRNFSASYGPIDAAMIPDLGANRFAFLKPSGIAVEYSNDGGSTWADYGLSDTNKTAIFANGGSAYLGKHSVNGSSLIGDQLRITISTGAAAIYSTLNKFAIYMSTSGNTVQVKMEVANEATPNDYTTLVDWTGISGWNGWNILNTPGVTTYGSSPSSQKGRVRFIFRQTAVTTTYSAAGILRIMAFGGVGWTTPSNMAKTGHLYSYDSAQNATFPAKVTASDGFSGNVTGNADSATNATNLMAYSGNEVTFGANSISTGASSNDSVWINYRDRIGGSTSNNATKVVDYYFGNRKGNTNDVVIHAAKFSGDVEGKASNVTGTVAVANGGTGKTTANDAADNLISGLPAWTANPTDDTYFVRQDTGGTSTFGRVKFSTLWNYIKGKFSGTSPITFSNGAIGINTASTSGYGATKLSTATNSTATDLAATPSAVKTAYDLANTANGTANTALSGVNGTLIYDHTYSISNGVATFTAHVYQKGVEVTNNYADSCFEWSYKLASAVTGTPSVVSLGTGKTKTITISTLGYGGYVLGTFTPPSA